MKYLKYALLFLVPAVAFAATVATPDTVFPNALALALQVGGVPGAILLAIIALGWSLWKISNYFEAKDKREREAYEEDLRIRNLQATNTARMQRDAAAALMDNMDLSYKQDYDYFIQMIKVGNYKAIYNKIAQKFHEPISTFIYNDATPAEERSARVILVIRQK